MDLSSISRWIDGRGKRPGRRPVPSTRLGLEVLERREVPAGLTGGLSNGVLTINGSEAADTITLTQSGGTVRIERYSNTWSAGAITGIRINAAGGDDNVRLAVNKELAATLVADGGSGRDVLYTTAQPASWTGFESGYLIAPPAGTDTTPRQGAAQVVWTGSTGPYTVSYYRRGDTANGELDGIYKTRQDAENAVTRLQSWASRVNNGGYWDVVRISVEREKSTSGPSSGPSNTYAAAFANAFRDIANRFNQSIAQCTSIVNLMKGVVERYRPYYTLFQNAIRIRNGVDQVLNNMTIRDVYNRYSRQSNYVWTNPSVLTFSAQQVRRQADIARDHMNQNLSGAIWAPVRSSANSVLSIVYGAADTMQNLAGAITRARSR